MNRWDTKRWIRVDCHIRHSPTLNLWVTIFQRYTRLYTYEYRTILPACFLFHKGSFVFSSLHACHQDERAFKDASEFKPERFLNEDGQFSVKLDKSLPFGAGKRLCAGETFARNAYFLVASALMQNFNFKMPANEEMPGVSETITGVLRVVPDYWLHVESRWPNTEITELCCKYEIDWLCVITWLRDRAHTQHIDLCYFEYSIANTDTVNCVNHMELSSAIQSVWFIGLNNLYERISTDKVFHW